MSGNNRYKEKRQARPEWYEDGPVKIYSKQEIDEWEQTHGKKAREILDKRSNMSDNEVYLEEEERRRWAENMWNDIMSGYRPGNFDEEDS